MRTYNNPNEQFDYTNQAWVVNGKYVRCGHPETMDCQCYGKVHEGESVDPKAEVL